MNNTESLHTQQIDLSKLTLTAGQYITVKTDPKDSDHVALRHYSLYSVSTDAGIQFAVRRDDRNEHHGLVSNYMHDQLEVSDTVLLSAPAGDFALNQDLVQQNEIPLSIDECGCWCNPCAIYVGSTSISQSKTTYYMGLCLPK